STAFSIPGRPIHDELNSIYGEASGLSTSARWSKLLRDGREEIEDKARPGRPITETTTANIEQVRLLIDDDLYITIECIQERADISCETDQRVIDDHLKRWKITAHYILKDLSDVQRTERVRICKQNLSKFQQETWRLCDIITDDESWFYHKQIAHCSPSLLHQPVFGTTDRRDQTSKTFVWDSCIKIHHDNGRPHVHKNVSDYLESEGLVIILHPPKSPDLSPCDFWLFDSIKDNLVNQEDSES
ncbi:unnamed protein product, partial [Rotaria magnacalcarata]